MRRLLRSEREDGSRVSNDTNNNPAPPNNPEQGGGPGRRPWWWGYAITLVLEAAVTAGLLALDPQHPLIRFPIVFVVLTALIAYWFGQGPAIMSVVVGWLAFTYFTAPIVGASGPWRPRVKNGQGRRCFS